MAITVTVQGVEKLITDLAKLTPAIERSVILRMSQVAYDRAQEGAGRHSKTGALFRSLYNRSIPHGREVGHDPLGTRIKGTDDSYDKFVIFGTPPHRIYPKNKKALRWTGGGASHFAKFVNHPGYRGDNYMQRAADAAIVQFTAIVTAAIKESA